MLFPEDANIAKASAEILFHEHADVVKISAEMLFHDHADMAIALAGNFPRKTC